APVLAAGLAHHGQILIRQHSRDVHACRIVPDEERLVGLLRIVAIEEVNDLGRDFLIDALRSVQRQRTLVLTRLVAGRAIRRFAPQHIARRGQADRGLGIHGAGYLSNARDWRVLAWWRDALLRSRLVDVGEAHALHRIEVIEIAPVFLE